MAYSYAGEYFDAVEDATTGRPVPGVAVAVYVTGTTTKATLYTDRTKATTSSNPTSSTVEGNLQFFADPGRYDLSVNGRTIGPVVVHPDLSDVEDVASITAAVGAVSTALTAEANTRATADTTNATAIINEAARATAAEGTKAAVTQVVVVGSNNWLKVYAANPDSIIAGAITRDGNGAATSAPVVWPDSTVGTYTADTVSSAFPGAVDAYHITYGSPATKTVTQPAVTRDSTTGAVTNRPAMTVA